MTQYLKQLEVTSIRICWGTVKRAQNSYPGEKKPEKDAFIVLCDGKKQKNNSFISRPFS